MIIFNPFFVWIVAPVLMPTGWFKVCGGSVMSTLVDLDGSNSKSKRLNTIDNVTTASITANSSPTHFLAPAPKGKKSKIRGDLVRVKHF